jgi:hypothetical protein
LKRPRARAISLWTSGETIEELQEF